MNCNFICIHCILISAEGGDEHYKRALGEMEIGYERVDALILISGIDKYIRPVIVGAYLAAFSRDALESAAAGSSDGKNASAVFLRIVYEFRRSLRQHIMLGVHMVILNILRLDGAECSETYMEGDKSDTDALFAQGVKEFGSEMQSGGRCGGAAALAGIDGLISIVIFELFCYIMRQRHLAYLIEQFKEHSVICEFCKAVAVRQDVNNLGEE